MKEDFLDYCDKCRPKFVKLLKLGLENIQPEPKECKHSMLGECEHCSQEIMKDSQE